jgi:membrane protease subunit (stomatin/prohibitin family)
MSKTAKLKANWGTLNKLVLRDVLTDLPMEVGANGEYEVQIKDPRKFYLELVGADKNFTLDKLKERLQGRILSEIEPVVAKVVREQNVAYYDLAEKKNVIAKEVFEAIAKMFEKDYGISLYSFVISKIFVANENIEKIENELKNRREEKTAKELAEEVERLGDKEFDREVLLKQLEDANYDKYLEVCKLIGCEPRPKAEKEAEQVDGNKFCSECGEACSSSDKFCSKCGNKLN